MKNFSYSRAGTAAEAICADFDAFQRQVSRRRDEPGRPDAREHRTTGHADRCDAAAAVRNRRKPPDGGVPSAPRSGTPRWRIIA